MSWLNIIIPLIISGCWCLVYNSNTKNDAPSDILVYIASKLMDSGFRVERDSHRDRLRIFKDESHFDITSNYTLVPRNGIVLHVIYQFRFNDFVDNATALNDRIANLANQRFWNTKCLAYNECFLIDRIVCMKKNSKDLKALVNQAISDIIEMRGYVVNAYRVAISPAEPEDRPATVGFAVPDSTVQSEEESEAVASDKTGGRQIGFR